VTEGHIGFFSSENKFSSPFVTEGHVGFFWKKPDSIRFFPNYMDWGFLINLTNPGKCATAIPNIPTIPEHCIDSIFGIFL
jgi:hypothetical protein